MGVAGLVGVRGWVGAGGAEGWAGCLFNARAQAAGLRRWDWEDLGRQRARCFHQGQGSTRVYAVRAVGGMGGPMGVHRIEPFPLLGGHARSSALPGSPNKPVRAAVMGCNCS